MNLKDRISQVESEILKLQCELGTLYRSCNHENQTTRNNHSYCMDCGHYKINNNWTK